MLILNPFTTLLTPYLNAKAPANPNNLSKQIPGNNLAIQRNEDIMSNTI
jgi:hypothetical protein